MSNKRPFDYIEEKIKLAAENSLPAFDEKAWAGMEKLLDKEKRRRPLGWLWFVLPVLIAGAGWGIYQFAKKSPAENTATAIAAVKPVNQPASPVAPDKEMPSSTATGLEKTPSQKTTVIASSPAGNVKPEPVSVPNQSSGNNPRGKIEGLSSPAGNERADPARQQEQTVKAKPPGRLKEDGNKQAHKPGRKIKDSDAKQHATSANSEPGSGDLTAEAVADNSTANATVIKGNDNTQQANKEKEVINQPAAPLLHTDKKAAPVITSAENKPDTLPAKKKISEPTTKSWRNRLYLLAAAGPDAGSTKLLSFSNSTVTLKYGVGVGYQFNNKWSIQTGFYAANKKYVAGPGDYHPEKGSYWDMVEIKKVKAACLIFEIPITVRYNLLQKKSLTYYVTAGVSSYIMQSENYNYYYIRYNTSYEKFWQYKGHRHLFSNLSVAAGVESKLSGKFSIIAEPSISVPITGVGDGKVKLYSASFLLGLRYLPFYRNK